VLAAFTLLLIATPTAARAADDGLSLVKDQQLDPRLHELTFTTPAVEGETKVRVLLPTGYDPSGNTRYPVLYLLHGAIDNYASWTDKGDTEKTTAGAPLIVVMPDSGPGGGYVDWYNGGAFGPPKWETYHVGQLLPWIDAHYPTVARREGRALAGLSMGGGGTMHYAARHPDLFVSASAFSPAVDNTHWTMRLVDGDGKPYGDYVNNEIRFRGHNPTDLVPNLRGLSLTLRTGNGQAGGPGGDSGDPVEYSVHEQASNMHTALLADGIAHVWDDYGAGGHTWFYWQRDLKQSLPNIMRAFAHPPARPKRFDYRSIDTTYSVWGWTVSIKRPALEFSELHAVTRGGFELRGSGSGTVTTAAVYKPRAVYVATTDSAAGTTTRRTRADKSGRLTLSVPLGPGNTLQEYSPEAKLQDGTRVFKAHVDIAREPRR
jgi:S-formylglutathione hydrolase FrmB